MKQTSGLILLIDDEEALTRSLTRRLRSNKLATADFLTAQTVATALELLQRHQPEAVVIDLNLDPSVGPKSGLELISNILLKDPSVRVIVLTGHGEDEFGIDALKRGAASFNQKPIDIEVLSSLLSDAVCYSKLLRKCRDLEKASKFEASIPGIVTQDSAMKPVLERILYAARFNQPTLLLGETGVGKGVIARAIHDLSKRKGPLIRYQPRYEGGDLVASELFGHEQGAFTGATHSRQGLLELADKGTLFLDEVDQLPRETQVSLLSALQDRYFNRVGSARSRSSNFALICASNAAEERLVSKSALRADFFHRIAHLIIRIPPLRDRPGDIVLLAQSFLNELINRENLDVHAFSASAKHGLLQYPWLGNVRELQAKTCCAAYRAAFNNRRFIELEDFEFENSALADRSFSFRTQVRSFELRLVNQALARCGQNQSQAAESLKLSRSQLRRILGRREDYSPEKLPN